LGKVEFSFEVAGDLATLSVEILDFCAALASRELDLSLGLKIWWLIG